MAAPFHTYGRSCLLADDEPDLKSLYTLPTPPEVRSQFFYASSLPIDDPLAPVPLQTGQSADNEKAPPQPFSARDNIALEKAWRQLGESQQANAADQRGSRPSTSKGQAGITVPGQRSSLDVERQHKSSTREDTSFGNNRSIPDSVADDIPSRHLKTQPGDLSNSFDARRESYAERRLAAFSSDLGTHDSNYGGGAHRKRERSTSLIDPPSAKKRSSLGDDDTETHEASSTWTNRSRDSSISGSPFVRAPVSQSHSPLGRSVESLSLKDGVQEGQPEPRSMPSRATHKPSGLRATISLDQLAIDESREEEDRCRAKIPVGASRLHSVELPELKMKPIYWSPLHDISNVVRATWFYKNTMMPVETELANKLEEGYNYLRPWTDTWQDELNSCVENGAEAETKIVHRLWPEDQPDSANPPATPQDSKVDGSEDGQTSDVPSFERNQAAGGSPAYSAAIKLHRASSAIYVDAMNAQILRPSLLPSAARGRRPLSAIRKERQIGIPVVRGFSRKAWDRLHPSKPNPVDVRQYIRKNQSRSTAAAPGEQICYACKMEEMRPSPTDLVLVIHGIGQKLSERMESWHFTHAVNAFRRQVNMELNGESVWAQVDQDHGGIMLLPVNWRSTFSLDSLDTPGTEDPTANKFSLDDITPPTLPIVRSLVSDVMLDIPYYLSHYKPKMIRAVVREANRIYRLWCKNNPGFQENGRVHVIAHSLGSVMGVDILSQQPTYVPHFDFSNTPLHNNIFEFDTRNFFICGSPVGFFLLLNKASLLPRRGREKPGSEGEDRLRGVAGEAGKYGCIAVDNIYNILHTTDPIAYRVNAAVDTDLAKSLKIASIPTTASPLWASFGSVFRWSSPPPFVAPTQAPPIRPAVSKLPSTVEMETHDFSREELAEKRMLLLNDNGQIDYHISGGGGMGMQYLNMLSAHSSYWTLTDFVRFFVVEIARKQGRKGTLVAFRAEKKKGWKYSKG